MVWSRLFSCHFVLVFGIIVRSVNKKNIIIDSANQQKKN
jgi:hypothetical protein